MFHSFLIKVRDYFFEWKPIHGWRAWLRFIWHIIAIIGLVIIDGLGLLPIIMIKRFHLTHIPIIIIMILMSILIYAITIFLAYVLYKHNTSDQEAKNFIRHPLLTLNHSEWVNGCKTFGLILLIQIVGSLANNLFFKQNETKNNVLLQHLEELGHVQLVSIFILSITLVPICEELIFRGCIINCFFKKYKHFYSFSVIACGFLFSLMHVSTNPISFLTYMLAGMTLAYGYEKSGSLRTSISCHALNNLIAELSMLLV